MNNPSFYAGIVVSVLFWLLLSLSLGGSGHGHDSHDHHGDDHHEVPAESHGHH